MIAKEASKKVGCSKGNVSYWKDKFLSMDALKLEVNDVIKTYKLTSFGLKILTRDKNLFEVVLLEDYPVKFLLLAKESVPVDWKKLGSPRNWEKLCMRVDGVQVVKTSKHVIIHSGQKNGFDADSLLVGWSGCGEGI